MRCMGRLASFSIVLMLIGGDTQASDVKALRGLQSVSLLVEELPPGAQTCGVDEQIIKNSIAYPLANSRLKIIHSDAGATLYVQITTIFAKDVSVCTSSINVEVYATQMVALEDTGNEQFVKIVLWQDSGNLLLSGRNGHREQLKSALEERAKKLVVDWTGAQR